MQETAYLSALAGLLHDVGKFAVRAGELGSRTWDDEGRRDYGYYHALLTADFIERYVPAAWRVAAKVAAGNHHRPQGPGDRVVTIADRLSAGERADVTEDARAAQPRQLLSIFCSTTADGLSAPGDAYWPLVPLRVNRATLFPGPAGNDEAAWGAYRRLWDDFTREAGQLRDAHSAAPDLPVYVESLLLLMQRYTWCMPSAYYRKRPDISLYDHNRTTAALAAVLSDAGFGDDQLSRLAREPEAAGETLALLVGGDLSGVQDFIYTISARGAASALRGRSFYLQMLGEAVARYILRRLDLPATNLIYAGGGNFYLLVRPGDRERLAEAQRAISRVMLGHHRGDLYLALAARPLAGRDFFEGRISGVWSALGEELQRAKQQRFAELGPELADLFTPQGHGGNEESQCQVCGCEDSRVTLDGEIRKCPACLSYERLGEDLRRARYLALEELPLDSPAQTAGLTPGGYDEVLAALGLQIAVLADLRARQAAGGGRRVVLALDDDALAELRPAPHTITGRRLLVNVTPTITEAEIRKLEEQGVDDLPDHEGVATFGALRAGSRGIARLGVLRMDVDNLGDLFANGLGRQATLSRVAGLSFAVSLYFEGWVGELAAEQNRAGRLAGRGEPLYSIYSGGDDLFFVGAWDAIVEFARRVRADLTPYAAGHPGIHASAGIALVGGKYPLYQAARDAGAAESRAKDLMWSAGGRACRKDALAFLGQVLPWDRLGLEPCEDWGAATGLLQTNAGLQTAHALMHRLEGMTGEGGAQHALLRRLIDLHRQYEAEGERRRAAGADQNRAGEQQVLWGPWMWLAVYTLTRMSESNRPARESIIALRDQLKADNFGSMEWIGLAARWAELLLR